MSNEHQGSNGNQGPGKDNGWGDPDAWSRPATGGQQPHRDDTDPTRPLGPTGSQGPHDQPGQGPWGAPTSQSNQPPQPTGQYPMGQDQPGSYQQTEQAGGFFKALFDLSFDRFITPTIAKLVYLISIIVIVLTWVGFIVAGLGSDTPSLGVVALVLGWIPALLTIIVTRIQIEFVIALIKTCDNAGAIRRHLESR